MTANTPQVFGLHYSVYTRIVLLALAEKGVTYDFQTVEIFGDSGVPIDHLERHPFGRIPVFQHDGFELYETAAITRYIDEGFKGPALQPSSARARARMSQVINVLDAYAYRPMVWDLYVELVSNPQDGIASDEQRVQAALPIVQRCLVQLSEWLAGDDYFVTQRLTLADLHAIPILHYLAKTTEGAGLLQHHPNLVKWMRRLASTTAITAMARRSDP